MAISLKVKNHTGSESGATFKADLTGDMATIETEANRIAAAVDPEHNTDGTHSDVHADAVSVGGKVAGNGAVAAALISGDTISLGGVQRTSWPTATPGSSGQVLQTGAIALRGRDGVTVTHNIGSTNYMVKVMLVGVDAQRVGVVSYVKAANTVTIYNTGEGSRYHAPLSADIEISHQ